MLSRYAATPDEVQKPLIGDNLVPNANLVVDSAFTIQATPEVVWGWLVQVGKGRGGWPLPYRLERFTPKKWHGLRSIDPSLQNLAVGDAMGDWSGKNVRLTAVTVEPEQALVYESEAKGKPFSWAMVLEPTETGGTRVHSRTRIEGIKRVRMAKRIGRVADRAVAAGLARGLEDRLGISTKKP